MEIRKVYRIVSLADCELIGQGANGKVYRYDQENILKVYTNTDALPLIEHERELSRAAFVLGIPTAIPYDVVQIAEGGYGTVYEMLTDEAKSAIDHADVILAKGQGNYESLSKQGRHIFYSLLCKCDLFIERFGVPRLTGIFVEESGDFYE